MKCKLWFCDNKSYARGYCKKHYMNWLRYSTPIAPSNVDLQMALVLAKKLAEEVIFYDNHYLDGIPWEKGIVELASNIIVNDHQIELDRTK